MSIPKAPKGLGIEGRRLCRGILAGLELDGHELSIFAGYRRASVGGAGCYGLRDLGERAGL